MSTVTVRAALEWSQTWPTGKGTSVGPRRMTAARGFARYLAGIDENTEVPPLGLMPNRQRWRRPFIFTPGDIEAVMSQARTTIESPLRAATYDTLIGLLATAGLRIGEAIKLDRSDVDWDQSVLLIRESKFGKSRLVPLHVSSVNALAEFAALREDLQPHPNVASFFMSLTRNRLSYAVVQETFRRLVDSAGVGAGAPSPPRLHDRRHSSPSRSCSVGIEATRTSKRRSRHCRPTSSVANQPRPTGICLLPRSGRQLRPGIRQIVRYERVVVADPSLVPCLRRCS